MTDIEQKALELVNRIALDRNTHYPCVDRANDSRWEALCRVIEAHELDKARHAAEMREQAERFSEVIKKACAMTWPSCVNFLKSHMLTPVDPLTEVLGEVEDQAGGFHSNEEYATALRAALEARGLAIVKREAVNG